MNATYCRPAGAGEQTLIYKKMGERDIEMLFFPPTTKVFDRAPVYVIRSVLEYNAIACVKTDLPCRA